MEIRGGVEFEEVDLRAEGGGSGSGGRKGKEEVYSEDLWRKRNEGREERRG